jgi:hypothetical protein
VQQYSQPGEDETEVVANGREDEVGSITVAALGRGGRHFSCGRSRARWRAAELAFDHPEHAALLAGDEEAVRIVVLWPIALVDVSALDSATGEFLGGFDDLAERVPVIGVELFGMGITPAIIAARLAMLQIRLPQPHAVLAGQPAEPLIAA